MVIIEDTRNQVGKHQQLNEDLQALGHQVVRSKLFVGDYAEAKNQSVCIDTKQNIRELASNIMGKSHARFREECYRAFCADIRLIVLIEEETPIQQWKSPNYKRNRAQKVADGEILWKAMVTMHIKYGVQFRQCNPKDTAKVVIEILKGE